MAGKRLKEFNTSYFSNLDSESTYWLGFIQADGCVQLDPRKPTTKTLRIEVHADDAPHLDLFRQAVGANSHELKPGRKNTVYLSLTSRELCDDLISLGVKPRKSFTGSFPTEIPKEFLSHYLRGVFDGDGCITIRKSGRPRALIVGSKGFCNWSYDILASEAGITGGGVYPISTIMSVEYTGWKQVGQFKDFIYKESTVSLNRKRLIFESLFSHRETDGFLNSKEKKVS
ncbi:hypothetical protein [Paenibacillus campinasensis]|uniref:DOD-type homing endonuclease domain-containing protein n=1 Tax=Paenibacillus campinasensis TaxID=66347 RepID=A0A268EH46_9BACL|nr:hypothetical protein [Paenibacillus campinasensis]PAD72451.1 hypothetical protein CHH67_22695 [Paenibacillus campinasensis]